MPNPNVPQGTLNRLKVSVTWANFPELNVTPAFLGKEMVSLTFDGKISTQTQTATGVVQSPEPYQQVTISIHLLKTQSLAPAYKAQLEASALLGDGTVWPDVSAGAGLPPYNFSNCAISDVRELVLNGVDAGWVVMITGIYYINADLWN